MWKTWAVSHLSESEVDMGPVFSFYAGKESRGEAGGGQRPGLWSQLLRPALAWRASYPKLPWATCR